MIQKPINETLPADGGTAVKISLETDQLAADWAVQARGNVDMKISDVEAMTTYWTVKAGTAISINESVGKEAGLFYAISGSSEDVVEVLPLRRWRNK